MPETFRCPSCSAPLEFAGKPLQKCSFCGSNVIVPTGIMQDSGLFGGAGRLDFGDLSRLTGRALKIAEIQQLIQRGRKIEAIKLFRETFGGDLKHAKDAVEAMQRGESVDVSGMQIRPARVSAPAPDRVMVKRAGLAIGGSVLGILIGTMALVIGILAVVFYFVSGSIDKAFPVVSDAAATPQAGKTDGSGRPIAAELLRFGGEGTGAGKFKDNRVVAVDPEGRIYSADYSGGRIQIFDAAGNFVSQILGEAQKAITALAVDRKKNLFVLQNYELLRFNSQTGELLGTQKVAYAADLTVGLDGRVYIPTRKGAIVVLSAEGQRLKTIEPEIKSGLDDIAQLAVDANGSFYAMDRKTFAVFKLSPEGKFLTRFGGRSETSTDPATPSMFYGRPNDMIVDHQNRVLVSQGRRISAFDANGNYLSDFKTSQAFGMAAADSGELFVAARPFVVKYRLDF